MAEEKEQPRVVEELLRAVGHFTTLSGAEYVKLGSFLEGLAHEKTSGSSITLVDFSPVRQLTNVKMTRGPFGVLPKTLLHFIGAEALLVEHVVSLLQPVCSTCGVPASAPVSIGAYSFPPSGYLALIVEGKEPDLTLNEWCELLGTERVIVDGRIVRVSDEPLSSGQPVLSLVDATNPAQLAEQAARWFSSGGSSLGIGHLAGRSEQINILGTLSGSWTCPRCNHTFQTPSLMALGLLDPCVKCRGEGWLISSDSRYVACSECDGFGAVGALSEYLFQGNALRRVPLIPVGHMINLLSTGASTTVGELVYRLTCAARGGFSDYPIGCPVELFSTGENALLTAVMANVSRLSGLELVIDAAAHGLVDSEARASLAELSGTRAYACTLPDDRAQKLQRTKFLPLWLRDIHENSLSIDYVELPRSCISLVTGPSGSGKSTFLQTIAQRFSKRRKLAGVCDFGDLKSCELVRRLDDRSTTVLELLRLGPVLDGVICATMEARRRGYTKGDFDLPRSRYKCHHCQLGGDLPKGDICPECRGGGFDPAAGSLVFRGTVVQELMTEPFERVEELLWDVDLIARIGELLAPELRSRVKLSTTGSGLAPSERRFLSIAGQLAAIKAKPVNEIPRTLILLDGPLGVTGNDLGTLLDACHALTTAGATIVWAENLPGLESAFEHVLRLITRSLDYGDRRRSNRFDIRMSRPAVLESKQK